MRVLQIRGRIRALALLVAIVAAGPADGAIRLLMVQGRPLVDGVFLNGHGPYRFLVDTGTTLNHFDPKLARSAGFKPEFQSELVSSTGVTRAPGAAGIEVTLDDLRVGGQRFLFAGIDALHERYPDVQGVLGQEFLSRFDYLLDLQRKRIEIGRREPGAAEVRAPFRIVAGRPVVATNLGSLVLDSGANRVTLFHAVSFGLTHQMITMTGTSLVGFVSSKLVIGGRTFWHGEAVAVPQPAETEAAGLLPAGLFRKIYVSNSDGYLVFD